MTTTTKIIFFKKRIWNYSRKCQWSKIRPVGVLFWENSAIWWHLSILHSLATLCDILKRRYDVMNKKFWTLWNCDGNVQKLNCTLKGRYHRNQFQFDVVSWVLYQIHHYIKEIRFDGVRCETLYNSIRIEWEEEHIGSKSHLDFVTYLDRVWRCEGEMIESLDYQKRRGWWEKRVILYWWLCEGNQQLSYEYWLWKWKIVEIVKDETENHLFEN